MILGALAIHGRHKARRHGRSKLQRIVLGEGLVHDHVLHVSPLWKHWVHIYSICCHLETP